MRFSMEEVLHELAPDSDSDDKSSSVDSSDFGRIIAYYIVCRHTKCGRDLWRYTKVMGHRVRLPIFLSVFHEAGVVQQRTEAQAGMLQDGLQAILDNFISI